MKKPTFNDLINSIYESSLNPESWGKTLDAIRLMLDAEGTYLWDFSAVARNVDPTLISFGTPHPKNLSLFYPSIGVKIQLPCPSMIKNSLILFDLIYQGR